jgi:hypothetical protein
VAEIAHEEWVTEASCRSTVAGIAGTKARTLAAGNYRTPDARHLDYGGGCSDDCVCGRVRISARYQQLDDRVFIDRHVGTETCAGCHEAEAKIWSASQHKAAMQRATEKTVLGNFNDAGFEYYGVRSRFFRKGNTFLVETDGPDGKLATFEIKYTFGIDPLQQYLIEFPDGRIQVLPIA